MYDELLDDMEETLSAEGFLMLYRVAWRLNTLAPELGQHERDVLHRAVYDELRQRRQLAQVWIRWRGKGVLGGAEDSPPDFFLDPQGSVERPIMTLYPIEDLPPGLPKVSPRTTKRLSGSALSTTGGTVERHAVRSSRSSC